MTKTYRSCPERPTSTPRWALFRRSGWALFRRSFPKDERINRGLQAYDLAAKAGLPSVEHSLRYYGVMPSPLLEEPERSLEEVRKNLATQGAQAALVFGNPGV